MSNTNRCDVFISYANEDSWCRKEVVKMLAPELRRGSIELFDDTMIVPGTPWNQQLMDRLSSARVGLLLLSPNFLNSEYIMEKEWPIIRERAQRGDMVLFWVCVDDCLVKATEINDYQAAWPCDRPLHTLSPAKRNEALRQICQKLLEALHP